MCWGIRGPTYKYYGVLYSVHELLDDPHVGGVWYSKPHVRAHVNVNWVSVEINGTSRHMPCCKLDSLDLCFCLLHVLCNPFQK